MNAIDFSKRLAERVETLREDRGDSVALGDVAEVVESIVTTIDGDISAIDIEVHKQIRDLVDYIENAKQEIAAIRPTDIKDHHIPAATDELDAIVKATEDATGSILDAAEDMEKLAERVPAEVAETITGITAKIYEASNFQDITGQRITKVVNTLQHIEHTIIELAGAFGHDVDRNAPPPADDREGDAALLNGPQLPEDANSQADIDALLASFD
jgi:chemotaxis protein CheZ